MKVFKRLLYRWVLRPLMIRNYCLRVRGLRGGCVYWVERLATGLGCIETLDEWGKLLKDTYAITGNPPVGMQQHSDHIYKDYGLEMEYGPWEFRGYGDDGAARWHTIPHMTPEWEKRMNKRIEIEALSPEQLDAYMAKM